MKRIPAVLLITALAALMLQPVCSGVNTSSGNTLRVADDPPIPPIPPIPPSLVADDPPIPPIPPPIPPALTA